jgi:NAD(P)-dependent dehydrogenase (short-subunit alcohol dehydrogenase family)
MELDLQGNVAIVTGAGRPGGIGRAIARSLAAHGADVVVTDIHADGLVSSGEPRRGPKSGGLSDAVAAIEETGRRALAVVGDVGSVEDVDRIVDGTLEAFGRIDILVNNAGAARTTDRVPVIELGVEDWNRVLSANLTGTFLMTRAVLSHMVQRSGGGRVINISSTSGKTGDAREAAYCASKFGVIGFTQAVSREVGAHGITVNAICPGLIETERVIGRLHEEYPDETLSEAVRRRVAKTVPVARIGTPADVANLVTFLAGPESGFINGQSYNVCGGEVMH